MRTRLLVLISVLGETYPRELARLLDVQLYSVQRVVDALDREGILATRLIGKERRVSLDPRFFAAPELRVLLGRIAEGDPSYRRLAASLRRRPRRKGKAI